MGKIKDPYGVIGREKQSKKKRKNQIIKKASQREEM
jgi:hypothetical protein